MRELKQNIVAYFLLELIVAAMAARSVDPAHPFGTPMHLAFVVLTMHLGFKLGFDMRDLRGGG